VRRIPTSLTALGVLTALGLCSCTSESSGPTDAASGVGGRSAACSVAASTSSASPTSQISPGTAKGTVGVILPATGSVGPSATQREADLLTTALGAVGLTPDVHLVQGDDSAFVSVARTMIDEGAEVLIVDSVGSAWGEEVERAADLAGVEVVDYDRMNAGGSAAYWVSFDYRDVGRLQAQMMVACLEARGVEKPKIILVDGGTDVDQNAVLLAIGAHQVLDPLVSAGKVDLEQETTVKGWETARAAPAFTQALDASDGRVDAVLAADDDLADAVIGVLAKRGLDDVVVAGQGPGGAGMRNIVAGRQSTTVYTDPRTEADAAAQLAVALVSGRATVPLSQVRDPVDAGRLLEAMLLPGQAVTRANVASMIQTGALSAGEICRGIGSDCTALGLP
jgi:D-xylose transport system substrate-binding protein